MKKIYNFLKKLVIKSWEWIKPYLTPRMIPIIITVWMVSNGMWYLFAFAPLGLPSWFVWFARSYIAFLYMPFTIEKPIIIAVSIVIYRLIYRQKFYQQGASVEWRMKVNFDEENEKLPPK